MEESRKMQMSVTDEWIKKRWSTCTREYYSCPQRSEALTHVTMWLSLENMMLSARGQTQEATWEALCPCCILCMKPRIQKVPNK